MKKTKDATLIMVINVLTTLITIAFTLYRVEWDLVDSFLYFMGDMFLAFFRNLISLSYIIYLIVEWFIKTPVLYVLSNQENINARRKHAVLGGIPFFGFFYGLYLQKNKKAATTL